MTRNSLIILLFALAACASFQRSENRLSIERFEKLAIGAEAKTVTPLLGSPTEVHKNFKDDPDENWIYNDENGFQRGTISIAPTDRIVTGVMIIPKEHEPESNVKFLLETKFASIPFEKAPLQRCGRHYVPYKVFYIGAEKGILIVAHRDTGEVESFSRATPEYAADLLRQIHECRR